MVNVEADVLAGPLLAPLGKINLVIFFVVLVTQLISDIGYVFLNPRIRIA